jgi:hypothetical protein
MVTELECLADAPLDLSFPANIPESWRQDVSKLEMLLRTLLSRHDELELAQMIVLAASRNLPGNRSPRSGLAGALVRGVAARQQLKDAEGGGISAEEARRFLGNITKVAVLDRYKKGRLVGWRESRQNSVRFPLWQFTSEGLLPGLEEVLAVLHASERLDDWAVILFFLNNRDSLGGKRPVDLLREGHIDRVLHAAQGYSAD